LSRDFEAAAALVAGRSVRLTDKPRLPIRKILAHGWLPSPLKVIFYRLKGYRIGRGVRFGFGAIVDGQTVQIGDGTALGLLSFVRGKTIVLGSHVQIGATTMIDTPHVEIGDGTRINEQVFVGGLQFPDSKLTVGRNCQIMQMTFINPTRSITIGDDSGIGGDCLVFGHSSWLSKFEGYPVQFDSIEIGSSVSLSWRVFVLPGTKIGDGAVIGANSLVRGTIPPRCLAVGFPARVVSRPPEFPREVSLEDRQQYLREMLDELTASLQAEGLDVRGGGQCYEVVDARRSGFRRRRSWRLAVEYDDSDQSADVDVVLSLRSIARQRRDLLSSRGVMWIDIESKERSDAGNPLGEEVAQHLRRYGVRFFRVKP
jgi:acetyltransferase-like isoleucine patch superfamily enzyme